MDTGDAKTETGDARLGIGLREGVVMGAIIGLGFGTVGGGDGDGSIDRGQGGD